MVKGARPMSAARRLEWLKRLSLARISVAVGLDGDLLPAHADAGQAEALLPSLQRMLGLLTEGPLPLTTLSKKMALPLEQVVRLGALLSASGNAALALLNDLVADPNSTRSLNRALARAAMHGDQYQVLASPVLGGGLRAGLVQRLIYSVLAEHPDIDDTNIVLAAVREQLDHYRDGIDAASGQAAQLAALEVTLAQTVEQIMQLRVPMWRLLQVL
jgi:hypothetical protein